MDSSRGGSTYGRKCWPIAAKTVSIVFAVISLSKAIELELEELLVADRLGVVALEFSSSILLVEDAV